VKEGKEKGFLSASSLSVQTRPEFAYKEGKEKKKGGKRGERYLIVASHAPVLNDSRKPQR